MQQQAQDSILLQTRIQDGIFHDGMLDRYGRENIDNASLFFKTHQQNVTREKRKERRKEKKAVMSKYKKGKKDDREKKIKSSLTEPQGG